jgi:hypothetical protein
MKGAPIAIVAGGGGELGRSVFVRATGVQTIEVHVSAGVPGVASGH